jgi:hypothetical protein
LLSSLLKTSCQQSTLFEFLPSSHTGIIFSNTITESDSLNVLNFEYIYNGAGVGIGDFNNDKLPDIFFSGNQVSSALYLNEGDLRFKDVTQQSCITTPYWSTGVSIVDINQDGWMDIYLCTANPYHDQSSPNQLFINQGIDAEGIPRFKETAVATGLDDRGYSTQAAFFDYDKDGDLDVYILTNALEFFDRSLPRTSATNGTGRSTDRLYRNDGSQHNGLPLFTNVSNEAGITTEGWGLGITIADINDDGWPDVYCANDFMSNDILWINNKDGTFTNRISNYIKHQSHNSMGADIADINNDGFPEIITLDMMPEDNLRQKMMFGKSSVDRYELNLSRGYQPQFVRNMLQLNNGPDAHGNITFSEIGQLAGISATDWSWSALLADFDNDGYRDLLVTNGYVKDVTSLDFVNYNPQSAFSFSRESDTSRQQRLKEMQELIGVKKPNFIFRNRGDLTFEDVTDVWGLKIPSYSNGAAYADLDRDGDLDLVINNLNDRAFLYENKSRQQETANHFISLRLEGIKENEQALGARVHVYTKGNSLHTEHTVYRGFKSSMEPALHFGLGSENFVDSIEVIWPDRSRSFLQAILPDQTLIIRQLEAQPPETKQEAVNSTLYKQVDLRGKVELKENYFIDYKNQVLLLNMLSRNGPAMAVGDVDGNGWDDVVVGAPTGSEEQFLLQKTSGKFLISSLPYSAYKKEEDAGILLLDADNDHDVDMLITSGGNEYSEESINYRPRFFRNERGHFQQDTSAVPSVEVSSSCAIAADFDRDGDQDIFIGGRAVPSKYPLAPRSYLLQNNNGIFSDITAAASPALGNIGMITAALWTDFDDDGWIDLLTVGEFMPITFFQNKNGKFENITASTTLPNTSGWWNSVTGADFDNDGDTDYVIGNFGRNNRFNVSDTQPLTVYAKDYDNNGAIDPVFTSYIQGTEFPIHPRDQLVEQIPALKKRFNSYAAYGAKAFQQVIYPDECRNALIYKAVNFNTSYLENRGNRRFMIKALPVSAQIAPIFGLIAKDVNADGTVDLVMTGNLYATDVQIGRYDAFKGLVLKGDGAGGFESISIRQTGLILDNDGRSLVEINNEDGSSYLFASNNNGPPQVYQQSMVLAKESVLPEPGDTHAIIVHANGKKQKVEFYYGSGYLSQSSRRVLLPKDWIQLTIINSQGKSRVVKQK